LSVWFERRGWSPSGDGLVEYAESRREVKPEIMDRQAHLDAGALYGLLQIRDVSAEAAESLSAALPEGEQYRDLTKRIAVAVGSPVARLVTIIRKVYGQFWLRPFHAWDSRTSTPPVYLSAFAMEWSWDAQKWFPVTAMVALRAPGTTIAGREPSHDYRDYLTQESWRELGKLGESDYEPSVAVDLVARAYQLLREGNLKYAFVEAGTAFELAAALKMKVFVGDSERLQKAAKQFYDLPVPLRLVAVTQNAAHVTRQDLEAAAEAVDVRNNIVHKGFTPSEEDTDNLKAFLRVIGSILPGPRVRGVELAIGNALRPSDAWEEIYARRAGPAGE
jgi:hypothetical protein